MTAIVNRWNDAGLATSIAKLYPAGESRNRMGNKAGSPEGTNLPRAEYMISSGPPNIRTRNSKIKQAIAIIQVYATTPLKAAEYLTDIFNAFVNSEFAETNPMVLANGDVLDVEDGGSFVTKEDDAVWLGQHTLIIRHRIPFAVPG